MSSRPSLLRDSGRTLVGTVVSNVANVLVVLLLARLLGGAAVGEYTLAFAARAILFLGCALGMRSTMTRFVATYDERGDHGGLRGSLLVGVLAPLALSTLVAAGWVAAAGPLVASVFDDPGLATPMRWFALSLPFLVLMECALAGTRGLSTMGPYTWLALVLEPGLRAGLTVVVLLAGGGVVGSSVAVAVSAAVAALASVVVLVRRVAPLPRTPVHVPLRELVAFGLPAWIASLATQGLLWADVLVLGVLVTSQEVGAYQVATRVVLMAMIVVTPLGTAMAPRVAAAWERGDRDLVARRFESVVGATSRLTWPVLAGVAAVPALVLALFGPGFPEAASVVQVLAVGAVAEVVGAPAAVVLNQIGRNRLNMWLNSALLALNLLLNIALVPWIGIDGAAVAWATTMVLGAVARALAVRRFATGRLPWRRTTTAALVAAVVAGLVAGLGVRLLPDVDWLRLASAVLVVPAVYVVLLAARGMEPEERRAAARWLWRRLPALRRLKDRRALRGATEGTEPLLLDELVRPLRLDVDLRADLYRLADAHPDLARSDLAAFTALVRDSGYRVWFEEVLLHRGHLPSEPAPARERAFADVVHGALEHWRREDAAVDPVTVTRAVVDGVDRWVLLDGGHRVALAMVRGRTVLEPSDYLVVDATPPDNTARLVESGRLDPARVRAFLDPS